MSIDEGRRAYASDRPDQAPTGPGGCWKGKPVAAALLRTTIALSPLLVASAVTVSVQLFVLHPLLAGHGLAPHVVAYVGLAAATLTTAVVVERLARRALPLVALLRLSMLFPDRAPSRFQMARTAGNPAALARLAEQSDEQGAAAAQVLALLERLTEHERRTRGHSERVRVYADLIGEQIGLDEADRMRLRLAAVVHDIGKLSVPADLLLKPGRPTPEEWTTLKGHPEAGIELAAAITSWLGPWTAAINEHHERFDGQGYPRGLGGEEIALAGRIVAVADAFETMTSARSYKKAMSAAAARKELADCAGSHFDPDVVRAFTAISLPQLYRRTLGAGILVNLPVLGPLQLAVAQLAAPVGSGAVAALSAGAPASAAAMTVLATSVAIGVVPAAAATGPPAPASARVAVSQATGVPVSVPRPPGGGGPAPTTAHPVLAATGPAATHPATPRPVTSGRPDGPSGTTGDASVSVHPTAPTAKPDPGPPAKPVPPPHPGPPAKSVPLPHHGASASPLLPAGALQRPGTPPAPALGPTP